MSLEDLIPEEYDSDPGVEPTPNPITREDLRQIAREERVLWNAEQAALATPTSATPATPTADPPSPEDAAKQEALDALARQEERARLVKAGRALLDEQYEAWGFDSSKMTDAEVLAEAGLVLSDEKRRERAIEEENRRLLADPAALGRALREKEAETLASDWFTLSPIRRERRAKDLGLDPAKLDAAARDEMNRRIRY